MEILRDVLVFIHLLGMAIIIGAYFANMRAPRVVAGMLHGAYLQLATGLLLVPATGIALITRPATVLVTVATIVAGAGMVRLGLWATRPTLRRVIDDGLARTE